MTADLPAWIPAEPGTSPAFPVAEGQGGRVIVLLSSEGALAGGWAGVVAVDLATAWGEGGARVVLADAGLSTPLLHESLGIPNHEGLVDALRWGVSVQRVVQRPEEGKFLAMTSGTAVADTAAVLAVPRWRALCAGFREAGVTLAVLIPTWEDALPAVLTEADGIVILAEPDEDLSGVFPEIDAPVLAVTGRVAAPEESATEAPVEVAGAEAGPAEAASQAPAQESPTDDEALPLLDVEPDDGSVSEDVAGLDFAFESEGDAEAEEEEETEADAVLDEEPEAALELEEEPPEDSEEIALEPEAQAEPGPTQEVDVGLFDEEPPLAEEAGVEEELPDELPDPLSPEAADAEALPDEYEDPLAPVAAGDDDFALPDPIPVPPSLEEIVEESATPARKSRVGVLLVVLVLVVAAAAVAAWFGYLEIPGLTPVRTSASSAPVPTPTPVAKPTPTSPVQSYSLALGAYRDGVVAGERVAALGTAVPGVLFQSVPVEVNGTLFHRVLAGPAVDSAGIAALAAHIAETASLNPSPWVPRWTPLAFQLGELPNLAAAERRVGALNELGVSAYILAVDFSDGSTRYRVFSGAFADESEASYLSGLLDERGLSIPTLSDRIGRLPE